MRTVVAARPGRVPKEVVDTVRRVLRGAGDALNVGSGDVTVRFVDSDEMRLLNERWRGKSSPTDVLSFPLDLRDPSGRRHIGDVAICWEVAVRQAEERGHSPTREAGALALHGLLHLLGYDHETDDGEMEALETELRPRLIPLEAGA